ncbi:hypothetical protein KQ306_12615 [Synechococcus sp. CS-1324]|uniref:Ycf66 family protein n=1 Tax=Synechococcus sp. CS-1324 TaxID=2847980 RepID=UPI000DB4BE9D|nr:Ycf66 family protein [Synechococcus sp. CS-1324]MCT0231686.1 hypothetical protein [Synechococcus sp. CS-1324]PZV04050.1 MAG: hypothetical protein DCF23_07670 [Cyanobium sp.]
MVNASLNWASIVGIVLAVGGAFLYFMRSFKPALARDYDVFFAAIGLLCGGILFFQGWRLDPILQFGQFLLAGTTVFFAYESVRLRGVTTEQARRSSYFDDDEPLPERGRMGGNDWAGETDRLDEPQPLRRRIRSRETVPPEDDDFYRPRQPARTAIPERAASRRPVDPGDWNDDPATASAPRPGSSPAATPRSRFSAGGSSSPSSTAFGDRRRDRDGAPDTRRSSRPAASPDSLPRSSRRPSDPTEPPGRSGVPQGTPIRSGSSTSSRLDGRSGQDASSVVSDADYAPIRPASPGRAASPGQAPSTAQASGRVAPRDNSSRFDN